MKKLFFFMLLYVLLSSGCEKNKYDAPGCIEDKINDFKKIAICDHSASVALYIFQGKNTYLFSDGSCGADLGTTVYSEECLSLGFLGGFTGNTLIQGVNFYNNAKFIKRIWEN